MAGPRKKGTVTRPDDGDSLSHGLDGREPVPFLLRRSPCDGEAGQGMSPVAGLAVEPAGMRAEIGPATRLQREGLRTPRVVKRIHIPR